MKTGKRVAGKDIPLEDFKKIILEVFEKILGFVNKTCEQLDMSRYTFNNYIKNDPEFKEKISEIYNVQCEFVESKLFDKIREGDTTAIMFYLKHKGHIRGYKESDNLLNSPSSLGSVTIIKLNGPSVDDIQSEDITNKPYISVTAPKNNDDNG